MSIQSIESAAENFGNKFKGYIQKLIADIKAAIPPEHHAAVDAAASGVPARRPWAAAKTEQPSYPAPVADPVPAAEAPVTPGAEAEVIGLGSPGANVPDAAPTEQPASPVEAAAVNP